MMCPDCRKPMMILELEGVEIDRCLSCGGTWLDAGELERIGAAGGPASAELSRSVQETPEGGKSGRRCPRCSRKLRLITIGRSAPVEIDRCPRCRGLWLDRGEIEAVTASSREGAEGALGHFFSEVFRDELERKRTVEGG